MTKYLFLDLFIYLFLATLEANATLSLVNLILPYLCYLLFVTLWYLTDLCPFDCMNLIVQ